MADKETVRAYMLALEKGPQESGSGAAVQRLDGYYYLPGAGLGGDDSEAQGSRVRAWQDLGSGRRGAKL